MQDDARLGPPPALVVGPASTRVSSLAHVAPPGIYPQGALASFYPDFLRNRNTPAWHDVVPEEVDERLLMSAHDVSGVGLEFTGLSAEIRDFLKK